MQVYATKQSIKDLEKASQGYMEAIQEIEEHVPGVNTARVHEEEYGRVLCQADNQKKSWHSAHRFVYGTDEDKEKALCVGHTKNHQHSSKGHFEYNRLKGVAKNITHIDFVDKIYISSKEILWETQHIADELATPRKFSRIKVLQNTYIEWTEECGEEGKEMFEDILKENLKEAGPLTNTEKKVLRNLPKTDPFRKIVEEISENNPPSNSVNTVLKQNSR